MPHCILEYSSNLTIQFDTQEFFARLHDLMVSFETISLSQIKSRSVRRDDFYIGDGKKENAYFYLQISLLERPLELRKKLGEQALQLLEKTVAESAKGLQCSVTVEIREINKETHFKL